MPTPCSALAVLLLWQQLQRRKPELHIGLVQPFQVSLQMQVGVTKIQASY
jgi:hypothetical protein